MTAANSKPRFFRLQFSLRWLLAVTAAVGIGLTIYRWPWTTERFTATVPFERPAVITTTWRRSWNGKPEKHVEIGLELDLHKGWERHCVNDEFWRHREFVNGDQVNSIVLRNGVLTASHTPQPDISGVWVSTKQFDAEVVTQRCAWRNAQRHGLSTWTSANGQVLQSAEFDRGRIVKWNGEPVTEALPRWIKERIEDEKFRVALLTKLKDAESYYHWGESRRGSLWLNNEGVVVVYYGFKKRQFSGPTDWLPRYQDRVLGEVILEMALGESGMFDYRYGAPCVVPICTSELQWQDPTNVAAVKFEPESPAAKEWLDLAHVDFKLTGWPAAQLRSMGEKTVITFDTSAVNHLDPPPYSGPHYSANPDFPRRLRDVFGHILYDAGYRCEQQGDTIVVLPAAKK